MAIMSKNPKPISEMGGKRPRGGRPIKLTPEIHERIVRLIRMRNFRETAAAAAGVDPKTLRSWLKRAASGKQPYKRFAQDMDRAEAEAEAMDIADIASAGKDHFVEEEAADGTTKRKLARPGDWRAVAWRLERRHADRWAEKRRHELSGPEGAPVQISTPVIMVPEESDD